MAFSSRFAKTAPKAAPASAARATNAEDSDEVESVDGEDVGRQREEEQRRARQAEERRRAEVAAARHREAAQEEVNRRKAADDARRRSEEDAARRQAYEEEKARQATIERSKREAARRAMGSSGGGGVSGFGGGARDQPFAWKKGDQPQQGLSFGQQASSAARPPAYGGSAAKADIPRGDLPSHDDCELGISAMISRTVNGMKEGLALLGLPNFPLSFIPGQELRLCGHDMREAINEMIHAWMTDERDEFYNCLVKVKGIVANPILTEEEMEMMDKKEQWEKVMGPDGKPRYQKRTGVRDDDDDDDEVIDVPNTGGGARASPAAAAAEAQRAGAAAGEEDFYALLGVDPAASLHEIRTKFRALVVTEHPEKGGDPKKFQRLNKAYSVLSDQKKRQEYDETFGGGAARARRFVD